MTFYGVLLDVKNVWVTKHLSFKLEGEFRTVIRHYKKLYISYTFPNNKLRQ